MNKTVAATTASASHPLSKLVMPLKFTVGMPVFDDFNGVWLTLQSLRLYHGDRIAELLVIDNNPDSEQGKTTKAFCDQCPGVRYIPFPQPKGPALAKQQVFENARHEHVVCLDSHIMLWPGALDALAEFYEAHPGSNDLLHGPLLMDNFVQLATHFDDTWPVDEVQVNDVNGTKRVEKRPSQMWGRWGRDEVAFPKMKWESSNETAEKTHLNAQGQTVKYIAPKYEPELPKATAKWFEIPAQGMGLFASRKSAFLGFNPKFIGFGGEEWYMHEKFRRAGRKVWCVSGLLWSHRFARPGGVTYPLTLWHKYRNYELGHAELGIDPSRLREHFIGHGLVPESWIEPALRGDDQPPSTERVVPATDGGGCVPCKQKAEKSDAALAAGDTLEVEYARVCAEPGDINEHLPTIRGLVETVGRTARVVELGTRHGVSTTALLAGKPARLVTYDAVPTVRAKKLSKYVAKELPGTAYEIRPVESVKGTAEECDLLLVDTDPHTADHIYEELSLFAPKVTRFIVFHDTEIYGESYGDKPGVMPAIRRWLTEHPEWTMVRRDKNNNGLVVISRDDRDKKHPPGTLRKLLNFSRAVVKHAADGATPTSEAEFNRRVELCLVCPSRNADVCGECGCPVMKKSGWLSEACPLGKWEKDAGSEATP